jgi:hypothetical protein
LPLQLFGQEIFSRQEEYGAQKNIHYSLACLYQGQDFLMLQYRFWEYDFRDRSDNEKNHRHL